MRGEFAALDVDPPPQKIEKLPCLKLPRQVDTPADMAGVWTAQEDTHTDARARNQQHKTDQMLPPVTPTQMRKV